MILLEERYIDLSPEEIEEIVESYDIDEDLMLRFEKLKQQLIEHKTELKSSQKYKGDKYGLKFKS